MNHYGRVKRRNQDLIESDLRKKMVFITGPRQVGKTYLAKQIAKNFENPQYLNYDNIHDQKIIHNQSWSTASDLLILDEVHKMKSWKSYLKGVFDGKQEGQSILVTGSARLDTFRQSGESLAGRYFHHRLLPLSVRELQDSGSPEEALRQLNLLGGFPEPFLSGDKDEAERWRKQYYTDLVREDILDFSRLHEVRTMRVLLEMLRNRVGSQLSYASLAGDLKIAPNTARKYVEILESLYIVFLVRPFHRNIARAIQKEPKLYFYDSGLVADAGGRLENTVAVCLQKHAHFMSDSGKTVALRYLRTKEKKEVDFVLTRDDNAQTLIEVKTSDSSPSSTLAYFHTRIEDADAVQLVENLRQPQTIKGIQIVHAAQWLANLEA